MVGALPVACSSHCVGVPVATLLSRDLTFHCLPPPPSFSASFYVFENRLALGRLQTGRFSLRASLWEVCVLKMMMRLKPTSPQLQNPNKADAGKDMNWRAFSHFFHLPIKGESWHKCRRKTFWSTATITLHGFCPSSLFLPPLQPMQT